MDPALETLLDGAIDYAGLFPPAGLDMEPALREFLGHLNRPESLLVNRFVCTATRLSELGDRLHDLAPDEQFGICVIGSGIATLANDIELMRTFSQRFGETFEIEGYEVRANDDVPGSLRAIQKLANLDLYLEIPFNEDTTDSLHMIANSEAASAKARTGGLDASAFPSSEQLANFLRECLDLNLSFKLTAGLHHPIRRKGPETGGTMHGFLNVMIALALAEEHDLNRAEIAAILDDENARNFVIEPSEVGHKDLRACLESIDAVRTLFAGFGSCSVSEPVEDLRALGLW
jgi:hypothetical protein